MLTIKNAGRHRLIPLLIVAALLAGCTPPGPRALLQGKKLLDEGRYADAIEELKTATALLNSNALAWNCLALAYHAAGQPTNAEPAYRKALAFDHDLVEVHYNLGCLWLEQNRLDNAKSELTTYTAFRKNSLEGWLKLATAQFRSVRPAPAPMRALDFVAVEKSYHEALRISPKNPEAMNGLGLIQLDRNRPREASQWFTHALKQRPDYAPALLNQAIVLHVYLNDRPAALQKYREYLALPGHPPNETAVQAAARDLEQSLNLSPRTPATIVASPPPTAPTNVPKPAPKIAARSPSPGPAEPASNTIQTAPAQPAAEKKVEIVRVSPETSIKPPLDITAAPKSAPVPTKPQVLPSKKANETTRTDKSGFFARLNPLNVLHRETKTTSPASVNSESDSTAALRGPRYHYRSPSKPLSGDSTAAQRAFAQGFQAQQANRLPEAIQSYRQATQLDPADYDAYYNLGLAATSAGNLQQALVAYEYALAIRPDSPDARYNFALVLKKANYLTDTVHELDKLLSRYPKEPRGHLALGNVYAQVLHQPAQAREHYLIVLDVDPRNSQAGSIRDWMMANPP